jgi:hypothetical protein
MLYYIWGKISGVNVIKLLNLFTLFVLDYKIFYFFKSKLLS